MIKKLLLNVLIWIGILFLTNCEDSTTPPDNNGKDTTLTLNYHIYYPLSQSDGWRPEHSGLFFYSFNESNVPERVLTESIVHLSSVGKNGVLVFQYEYLPEKFWVRHRDGTTLPIPFPQSDQSELDYFYSYPPHIELSGDGKKAVFFATLKRIDGTKPEEANQKVIVIDLLNTTLNIFELKQFYTNTLAADNVNFAEPYGKNILINEDGSEITFVLKGKNYNNNQFTEIGYYMIQLKNGTFNKLTNKIDDTVELAGMDEKANKIFFYIDNYLKVIRNKIIGNTSFTTDNMSNIHQFAGMKGEIAVWTDYGIELYNSANESKISDIVSWDTLKIINPDIKNMIKNKNLSISPDGGMIVFGFDNNTVPPSYNLYAIRRNGKDLKRLVPNTPIGIPVISWGIK